MDEKLKKYKDILQELKNTVEEEAKGDIPDVDVSIEQMTRELRQMIERLRRIKDGDGLTYEPVGQETPNI